MTYAGFWRRAFALIIDLGVFLPLLYLVHTEAVPTSLTMAFLGYLVIGVASFTYQIVLHAKYGQTVGKMLAGVRVTTLAGTAIGYRQSTLRSSVEIALWTIFISGLAYAFLTWSGPALDSLSFAERSKLIAERNLTHWAHSFAIEIWTWSEIITLLFNKKRRALHDFIAGTVVLIKSKALTKDATKNETESDGINIRTNSG